MTQPNRQPTDTPAETVRAVDVYDVHDWAVWGIDRWAPGERVAYSHRSSTPLEAIGTGLRTVLGVSLVLFFGYQVIGPWIQAWVPPNVMIWTIVFAMPLELVGGAWWWFRPYQSTELHWRRGVGVAISGKNRRRFSFAEIKEVRIGGEYLPERTFRGQGKTSDYITLPPSWTTRMDVVLSSGDAYRLADGISCTETLDGRSPRDRSHAELQRLAKELSAALNVPWRWDGFKGPVES